MSTTLRRSVSWYLGCNCNPTLVQRHIHDYQRMCPSPLILDEHHRLSHATSPKVIMLDEEQGFANVANRISSFGHEFPKAYVDTKKKASTTEGEFDRSDRFEEDAMNVSILNSKKSLIAWLVLCYSVSHNQSLSNGIGINDA